MSEWPINAARIREILTSNDLAATETAFIGDTVDDIETARDGGVMSIATLTGADSREKLCRANPDVMVRDLGELQRLLELAPPNDEIRIEALELMARVGVPDLERAEPQRLTVSMTLQPRCTFGGLDDDLARTIDYALVCEDLGRFVAGRQDKLIETLAHEMAEHLLWRFGLVTSGIGVAKICSAGNALRGGARRPPAVASAKDSLLAKPSITSPRAKEQSRARPRRLGNRGQRNPLRDPAPDGGDR